MAIYLRFKNAKKHLCLTCKKKDTCTVGLNLSHTVVDSCPWYVLKGKSEMGTPDKDKIGDWADNNWERLAREFIEIYWREWDKFITDKYYSQGN